MPANFPKRNIVFDVEWISLPTVWTVLCISIPIWFFIWYYLDSVLPSDFGVNKHPCFCCMGSKDDQVKSEEEDFNSNLLENDYLGQLAYSEEDPI